MGLFAYALGDERILAYDVLGDGSLKSLGESVSLTGSSNWAMCASGDTVFALSERQDEFMTYLDVFQADRASGQLFPRIRGLALGGLYTSQAPMVAIKANAEAIHLLFGAGNPEGTSSSVIHSYTYAPRFKTVRAVGVCVLPGAGSPKQMQVDGTGRMLFASMDPGEYGLASFTVDADGVLTMRDKALITEHSTEYALGVDPTQNFVYVGSLVHPEVQGYKVSQGIFTELKGVAEHLISPISSMTIDASGKYLFVSTTGSSLPHVSGNTIVSHSINPTTGLLTPINEQHDGNLTFRVTVTPDGKYLHAASFGTGAIYRYEINQGRLSKGVAVANAGIDILDFVLVNET